MYSCKCVMHMPHTQWHIQQECIPVGCVPSTAVARVGGVSVGGGVSAREMDVQGVSTWGVSAGGVCPGGWLQRLPGMSAWGVSAQWGYMPDTPFPCEQNDIAVKRLPYRNYVADGNKRTVCILLEIVHMKTLGLIVAVEPWNVTTFDLQAIYWLEKNNKFLIFLINTEVSTSVDKFQWLHEIFNIY